MLAATPAAPAVVDVVAANDIAIPFLLLSCEIRYRTVQANRFENIQMNILFFNFELGCLRTILTVPVSSQNRPKNACSILCAFKRKTLLVFLRNCNFFDCSYKHA